MRAKSAIAALVLLIFSGGCAKYGKVAVYQTTDNKQIEYLYIENNNSKDIVVFENGLGATMETWEKVVPEISKKASVFTYNRLGYGKSDAANSDRDGESITKELHDLLAAKGLNPPYVLVGHSLGGLYMHYYARRYPQDVKALILVDSTHPKQMEGEGDTKKWPWYVGFAVNIWLNDTQKEELRLVSKTGDDLAKMAVFTGKPVTVLSASKPLEERSALADHANKLRKDVKNLFQDPKQIWVDSGHMIQLEKPDFVIDVIGEALR